MIRALTMAIGSSVAGISAWGSSVQPLDHSFTLRNSEPAILEAEYRRMLEGTGPQTYIFPRACLSALDSSRVCPDPAHFRFVDTVGSRRLSVSPVGGYEFRSLGENVNAFDAGVVAAGNSGPLSFDLDARLFTELHEDFRHPSYDREFVERQDADASGSVAYSSYARHRSHFSYDWSWGRLTASHDAAHWGPGLYQNLTFSQEAVPFNQLAFTCHLGPVTVISLYGQLAPSQDWETDTTSNKRSLYAHRYEWCASRNLLLGVNEQLVLTKVSSPFSFIPVVPLFIMKAGEKEALNNGNLSIDASWRFTGLGHVYSEFFVDDLQSPTSLFDDHWGNKWGWMAGAHFIRDWSGWKSGLVAEYSRIEPWVYTHYDSNTSQTANFDFPLGNQAGPNSQSVTLKAYLRPSSAWYFSTRLDALWKGTDHGSHINDENRLLLRKTFLGGEDEPEFLVTPFAWYTRGWVSGGFQGIFGSRTEAVVRIQFQY